MSQQTEIAKGLYEAGQRSGLRPNSPEWWESLAAYVLYMHPAPTPTDPTMEQATETVEQALGGETISEQQHSPIAPPGSGVTPRAAAHRTMCSQRAAFDRAVPLDRRFSPPAYGYTVEDMKQDYPRVNPASVLELFFSHHIAKGDTSKNWLEKFWSFCLNANRIETERGDATKQTDSMGLPLDPAERARQVQVARDHARQNDAYIDQQIAAEAAEREGQQP